MNILIITFGSRGDVQPYVALGRGLLAAGHAVTLCTSSSFDDFVTAHGLTYAHASNALLDLMDSVEGKTAMEESAGPFGLVRTMIKLNQRGQAINRQLMDDSWAAAQAAEPDIIVFHPKAVGAVHIAEKLNIPAIMALPAPLIVPTTELPPIGLPDLKLGGWSNKLGYSLVKMGYRAYGKAINDFRRNTLQLDKYSGSPVAVEMADGRPLPVLHAYSPHVVPRPADWPVNAHVTGYWFLDDGANWKAPAALTDFLAAGPPPVYVGFGSMAGRDPQATTELIIEALRRADVRAILAAGWGGMSTQPLPASMFGIQNAPHDWRSSACGTPHSNLSFYGGPALLGAARSRARRGTGARSSQEAHSREAGPGNTDSRQRDRNPDQGRGARQRNSARRRRWHSSGDY